MHEVCGFESSASAVGDTGSPVRKTGAVGAETSREVRRVLYDGDGAVALTVARSLGLGGPLQMVGELVLLAVGYDASEAAEFAAQCTGALRVRGWDGDQELADAIDAARGIAVSDPRPLNELPVDLEQLADLIDGGPDSAGGRLDLTNGEVWPEFVFEESLDDDADNDDDPDRWLHVWPAGSRRAYDDMVDFTATRTDQRLRERLDRALDGRGAFRRFKDALFDWPGDREDWFAYSEDRRRGRAREWLAGASYRPAVRRGTVKPG
ncbi:MAG: hypothetical protein QOG22_857 [Pseudonocardiales bacterium]|nr:hypothetical protein [Pseudonocardiales bacterium]